MESSENLARGKTSVARHRGILLAVLVVLLAAAGGAAWLWFDPPLSRPSACDRWELVLWLLRDLSAETNETRAELVDRLQAELTSGALAEIDWSGAGGQLSADRTARLNQNAELLKRTWFERRVEQYAATAKSERCGFLDEQIDVLFRWLEIDERLFAQARQSGAVSQAATAAEFFDQIDHWMGEATGDHERHEQMVTGVNDAVLRWLATRPLNGQSEGVIHELAMHIAHDLESAPPGAMQRLPLSAVEQAQLATNGEVLLESWYREQAARFAQTAAAQREDFLDHQIKLLSLAGSLQGQTTQTASGALDRGAAAMRFVRLAGEWTERAPAVERERLAALTRAIQGRMLWQQMRTFFGGKSPK